MKQTTAKEKMLKSIRTALMDKGENPYFYVNPDEDIYAPVDSVSEVAFAEALTAVGGSFIYCEDERDMLIKLLGLMQQRQWNQIYTPNASLSELLGLASIKVASQPGEIQAMQIGITVCEALIARLGSVLVSSAVCDGRRMFIYPEVHMVLAYASQVVPDIKDAFQLITARYGEKIPSMLTFVTGPSRTADIEKTLVMGAHGPKELIVFMIDDNNFPEPS